MDKIRLTYECPCANFDVVHVDVQDWNEGSVVLECSLCTRTLHQLDGYFLPSAETDIRFQGGSPWDSEKK